MHVQMLCCRTAATAGDWLSWCTGMEMRVLSFTCLGQPCPTGSLSELLGLVKAPSCGLSCITWWSVLPLVGPPQHDGCSHGRAATLKVKKFVHTPGCPCLLLQSCTSCCVWTWDLCCHHQGGVGLTHLFPLLPGVQSPYLQMYGCVDLSDVLLCFVGNPPLFNECPFSRERLREEPTVP